jgi:hypothetical protein
LLLSQTPEVPGNAVTDEAKFNVVCFVHLRTNTTIFEHMHAKQFAAVVAFDKFTCHLIYRSVTFDSHLTTEDVFLTATASLNLSWQYLPSIITETSVGKEIAFGDLPIPHFKNYMSKCTIDLWFTLTLLFINRNPRLSKKTKIYGSFDKLKVDKHETKRYLICVGYMCQTNYG